MFYKNTKRIYLTWKSRYINENETILFAIIKIYLRYSIGIRKGNKLKFLTYFTSEIFKTFRNIKNKHKRNSE